MPFHGIRRVSIRLETSRNIVIVNPPGIEPVVQRRAPAAMAEHAAIPDTFQRWDFVVARPAACLGGEPRIGINGERQDSVFARGVRRRRETFCRSKFVVCVEWRGVAAGAALAFEDVPAGLDLKQLSALIAPIGKLRKPSAHHARLAVAVAVALATFVAEASAE